jgi:hypothetical protein
MQQGVDNFRRRLVSAIRDDILGVVNDPRTEARLRNIPEAELGTLIDLDDIQRNGLASILAGVIDRGLRSFLYGLDNQADGFKILYNGTVLNDDANYPLSDSEKPFFNLSSFDQNGAKRKS